MRDRTYKWFFAVLLLFTFAAAVRADTPLVSGQVVTENGVTRYIYTVTNTLSSSNYIYGLYDMILPNGDLPIGHNEPAGWTFWHLSGGNTPWDVFYWSGPPLLPGQSAALEIYTSNPVVTQWTSNWNVIVEPVEGRQYSYNDGTALPVPVPVPEPSSILALTGGIAGFGGLAFRRKKV